ncbi:MAG: saccharopine dehydrogenase NADP-binding domain-containing protein [Thermoplasmata archaeon]|nr:saccharopine dehydrogenase NADP-binding domain-containing protein [Thermoplasmata archaeon]
MNVLVLGAGMMGSAAAYDLVKNGNFDKVFAGDVDRERAKTVSRKTGAEPLVVNVEKTESVKRAFKKVDVVLSAVPYFYNLKLTKIAISMGKGFCDLGGNIDVVHQQLSLNEKARAKGVTIIPDCGLAPGMVNVLAAKLISMLDVAEEVKLRVGGLPQEPKPPLNYSLVFSAHGLINEYHERCIILRNGEIAYVDGLADLENFVFEGFPELEAFNTSGGSSTLPFTFRGRVKNLDYKTIRYAGHCEKIKLLFALGLASKDPVVVDGRKVVPRNLLVKLLETNLPKSKDLVLLRVTAAGQSGGTRKTLVYEMVDYYDEKTGQTAMMRTTAYPASVVAKMIGEGKIQKGVYTNETAVDPDEFVRELDLRGLKLQFREERK